MKSLQSASEVGDEANQNPEARAPKPSAHRHDLHRWRDTPITADLTAARTIPSDRISVRNNQKSPWNLFKRSIVILSP